MPYLKERLSIFYRRYSPLRRVLLRVEDRLDRMVGAEEHRPSVAVLADIEKSIQMLLANTQGIQRIDEIENRLSRRLDEQLIELHELRSNGAVVTKHQETEVADFSATPEPQHKADASTAQLLAALPSRDNLDDLENKLIRRMDEQLLGIHDITKEVSRAQNPDTDIGTLRFATQSPYILICDETDHHALQTIKNNYPNAIIEVVKLGRALTDHLKQCSEEDRAVDLLMIPLSDVVLRRLEGWLNTCPVHNVHVSIQIGLEVSHAHLASVLGLLERQEFTYILALLSAKQTAGVQSPQQQPKQIGTHAIYARSLS